MKSSGMNSWRSWGVAVACSIVYLLILAPGRLSGLLFVAFIERYNVDRETASYPLLICFSLRCLLGPFIGYLGEIFGYRAMTFWGCLFGTLGFCACFFAEHFELLYVSMGIFYGVGLGMGSTFFAVILKQHFDKDLSKATGVSLTGCCLSAFVICPIYECFAKEYGEAGAILLTSGVMLHALPIAMFLKNPHYNIISTDCARVETSDCTNKNSCFIEETKSRGSIETVMKQIDIGPSASDFIEVELHPDSYTGNNSRELVFQSNLSRALEIESNNLNPRHLPFDTCIENTSSPTICRDDARNTKNFDACLGNTLVSADNLASHKHRRGVEECETCEPERSDPPKINKHKAAWTSLNVFIDPSYVIVQINQALHGVFIVVVWTLMVDMSRDKGISHDREMYLLMFLPASEFFGYMSLGWVTDGEYLTIANFSCCCFICLALISCILVWSYNFATVMFGIFLFGVVSAAAATLFPPIIYKYINENQQSMALASRFLLFAVLNFLVGPMIGYFRENLGSYDGILYIMCICSLFAAIVSLLLPYTSSWTAKKQKL